MASTITAWSSGVRGVAVWPRVLFNSTLAVNLYFKDVATGTFQAWSGATGYTPSIKIRQPKGFNAIYAGSPPFYSGTVHITDGSKTRPIVIGSTSFFDKTVPLASIYSANGFLGGYSGAAGGATWVFNGGDGGSGVSADAVWAGTRCTARCTLPNGSGSDPTGTVIFEADSVGNQAALSAINNAIVPDADVTIDVLRQGTASIRELVALRITPKVFATVSSFSQITNGWSCSVPFTDPNFLIISNTAEVTFSEYQDYDCEIVVTKDSDASVQTVAVGKIRVYRKQIALTL